MGFLLLSILASTYLVVLFREIGRFKLSLLQTIAINYLVCVVCGVLYTPDYFNKLTAYGPDWLYLGIFVGVLFIIMFFMIGTGSQKIGVGYTAMITKLSVIIPTMVSFWAFADPMGPKRWGGIALAMVAIVFMHLKYFRRKTGVQQAAEENPRFVVLMGIILFFGSGLVDSMLRVFEGAYGDDVPFNMFIITLFGIAGVLGSIASVVQIIRGKLTYNYRNFIGGVLLGVPNYFSIVFVLEGVNALEGTVFFPLNNIGQLILAGIIGASFYGERLPRTSLVGVLLAVIAIVLVAFDDFRLLFAGEWKSLKILLNNQ